MTMKLSQAGRTYLKGYETGAKYVGGRKVLLPKGEPALTTYIDDVGVPTIGWGHTGITFGKPLARATTITREQCEELLTLDLAEAEDAVNKGCEGGAPTNQNQFDAMVLFAFNAGISAFLKSTLLKKHRKGDYAGAANQFGLWNKGKVNGKLTVLNGLTTRRSEEATIYRRSPNPIDVKVDTATGSSPIFNVGESKRVTPEEPEKLSQSKTILGSLGAVTAAVPVTVQGISTATDSLKQVKEQADQLQQMAWLSTILGFIIFALATYLIWKRWQDHNNGVK